jgi:hypothetical protein
MKKIYWVIFVTLLSGCATAEFLDTQNQCQQRSFAYHPVNNKPTVVTRSRTVRVQSGTQCINTGMMINCQPTYRQEVQYYDSNEMVDVNQSARNQFIASCTRSECVRRFGNADCER